MKCAKDGCNESANEFSNYCSEHQLSSGSQTRLDEGFSRKKEKEDKDKKND